MRNKKAEEGEQMAPIIKILLWIALFLILFFGVKFLINKFAV